MKHTFVITVETEDPMKALCALSWAVASSRGEILGIKGPVTITSTESPAELTVKL